MLLQFEPFREVDRLTRMRWSGSTGSVPMDAYRVRDEVVASFDLPGVDPASIEVTIDGNVLSVSAERPFAPGDDADVLVAERPHGRWTRQVHLGNSIDTGRIEAHYDDGVVTVRMPRAEHATPRRVAVSRGDQQDELAAGAAA